MLDALANVTLPSVSTALASSAIGVAAGGVTGSIVFLALYARCRRRRPCRKEECLLPIGIDVERAHQD